MIVTSCKCNFCCQLFFVLSCFTHTDLQLYLLFADGEHGTIYRSNLDASGIQQLVTGLPRPIALDFDYRSMQSLVNIKSQNLTWDVNRKLYRLF